MSANAEMIALLREIREDMRVIREEQIALRGELQEVKEAYDRVTRKREHDKEYRRAQRAHVARQTENVARQERKEGERENSPHTPYREKEGERKEEAPPHEGVRARPCEGNPRNQTPPPDEKPIRPVTFAQLLSAARDRYNFNDEAFVREVYNRFEASGWRDAHNEPINAVWLLAGFIKNRARFERLRDPERLHDARKPKPTRERLHADNFLQADRGAAHGYFNR